MGVLVPGSWMTWSSVAVFLAMMMSVVGAEKSQSAIAEFSKTMTVIPTWPEPIRQTNLSFGQRRVPPRFVKLCRMMVSGSFMRRVSLDVRLLFWAQALA